jgi:hypothetical protein
MGNTSAGVYRIWNVVRDIIFVKNKKDIDLALQIY